ILYIIKTHFDYNLDNSHFEKYSFLLDYFRTAESSAQLLKRFTEQLDTLSHELPLTREALGAARTRADHTLRDMRDHNLAKESVDIHKAALHEEYAARDAHEKNLRLLSFLAGTEDSAPSRESSSGNPESAFLTEYKNFAEESEYFHDSTSEKVRIIKGNYTEQ